MPYPFCSEVAPRVSAALLGQALGGGCPRVALVNAGAPLPLAGIREAQQAGLATPVLIGDPVKIRAAADQIEYDISDLEVIDAPRAAAVDRAADLARRGHIQAIMKGQVHSATFLKGLLPLRAGLRAPGARCAHVFHVTAPGQDRALLITDAALNVAPDVAARKSSLVLAVALARRLGVARPKAALLAPTEDVIPSVPSTIEAVEIAAWARTALPQADVAGPMAMDLILSAEAAAIKGYTSAVAGDADIIVVPEITSGNALVKLMVLGMGCCAGGVVLGAKVPILLTSRAQGSAARLASAALGAIVARGEAQ